MVERAPCVAFLGMVERHHLIPDGTPQLGKFNLLGLKAFVPSHIFPALMSEPSLAFAFYDIQTDRPYDFCIRDEAGVEMATLNMKMAEVDTAGPPPMSERVGFGPVLVARKGWTFQVVSASKLNLFVQRPGPCDIFLREDGQETLVGTLTFVYLPPEPLTEARKAAIRTDPRAMKAVRAHVSCSKCQDLLKVYAGLEKLVELETEGHIWFEDLPNSWECSCGSTKLNLTIWKTNFHGLLGLRDVEIHNSRLVPLYEGSALISVHRNFSALLQENLKEEPYQKFIEENPVLLHQFTPKKLWLFVKSCG